MFQNPYIQFSSALNNRPHAVAIVTGSDEYASIRGRVSFYQTPYGVIVTAEVAGLPMETAASASEPTSCRQSPIFGFHIHEGTSCSGTLEDPYADAMTHFNPNDCPHPYHAGDLPPLFGCNGYAFSAVLTDRFAVKDIIGRTVIIHANPDDFTTQPSGNSGAKIACGVIAAT